MNLLKTYVAILVACLVFFSCDKEDITTGTRVKITIYDAQGSIVSGAIVSMSRFDEASLKDKYCKNNYQSKTTDENGQVTFGNLSTDYDYMYQGSYDTKETSCMPVFLSENEEVLSQANLYYEK